VKVESTVVTGILTLVGAALGFLASRLTARTSERNQRRELREKWVHGLREDLAELMHLAAANVAWGAGETEEGSPIQARRVSSKIRLRLTSGHKQHEDLDRAVNNLRRSLEGFDKADIDEQCEAVLRLGKVVLKEAWDQAKTGE
jgi:hypothetical protein